jgi:4-cresol dehydrogenase (hydroxylating)
MNETTPLSPSAFEKISGPWRGMNWIGMVGLYSASRLHARADRAMVKKALKPHAARFVALTRTKARLCSLFEAPLRWITKKDIGSLVKSLYSESVFVGTPTQKSVQGMYWRKRGPIPAEPHPERDNCGVLWLCPTVPFTRTDLAVSVQLMKSHLEKHDFEPLIAMTFPSARSIYVLPSIVYDRDVSGEDSRALLCHDDLLSAFIEKRYFPHRLGIQSMGSLPAPSNEFVEFWRSLKGIIDPSGILSPGRYSFSDNINKGTGD